MNMKKIIFNFLPYLVTKSLSRIVVTVIYFTSKNCLFLTESRVDVSFQWHDRVVEKLTECTRDVLNKFSEHLLCVHLTCGKSGMLTPSYFPR